MDLHLNINPDSWHLYNKRCRDEAFKPFAKRVFERDNNTCSYCGFTATEEMCCQPR